MINKKIKFLFTVLLAVQMIIPSSILAAAVGQFTSVIGNVAVTRAGLAVKPAVKASVEANDVIVTGDKSFASIFFDDESAITVAPNSRLEIKELTIKGDTRKGLFALSMGKLSANVRKFIGGRNTFEIQTPNAVAGVRGTGLEIVFAMVPQMATQVTCSVGAVSVSSISATGAVLSTSAIVAGQSAMVTSTGIVVSGVAVGAAGTAGAASGAAASGGIATGTVAAAAAAAAAAVAAGVATAAGETTSTHHHSNTD